MAEIKDIVVRIKVEGDTEYLNALAKFEAANARRIKGQADLAKALATVTKAQGEQARAVAQSSTALTTLESQSGRSRQATVQLGQQVQDFAIQVQNGGNFIVAFTQQMSQAAYVAQGMGGTVGTVAEFLVGPWGAALTVALAALTPFIEEIIRGDKATQEAIKDTAQLAEEYRHLTSAQQAQADIELNKLYERRLELQNFIERQPVNAATGEHMFSYAQQQELQGVQQQIVALEAVRRVAIQQDQDEADSQKKVSTARTEHTATIRKQRDAFADYIAELNKGQPQLAKLNDEIAETQKALASGKLTDVGAAEARARLADANERLGKTQRELAAAKDPLTKYIYDAQDAEEATSKLADTWQRLADTVASGQFSEAINNELRKAMSDIEYKLNPALKSIIDEENRIAEKGRIYIQGGRGGAAAGQVFDQIREQQKVVSYLDSIHAPTKQAEDDLSDLEAQYDKMNMTFAESEGLNIGIKAIDSLTDGLGAAIQGTESFGKAFEDMSKLVVAEITKLVVKFALLQAFQYFFPSSSITKSLTKSLGFADGGVIQNGSRITAYASGGVVTRPTVFPMANGMGLMGEAGPEAVMPLTRTSDGKLGVQSTGANVIVNNYGNDKVTVDQKDDATIITIAAERARALVASDIRRGDGMVSNSLQGTYRLSRNNR